MPPVGIVVPQAVTVVGTMKTSWGFVTSLLVQTDEIGVLLVVKVMAAAPLAPVTRTPLQAPVVLHGLTLLIERLPAPLKGADWVVI